MPNTRLSHPFYRSVCRPLLTDARGGPPLPRAPSLRHCIKLGGKTRGFCVPVTIWVTNSARYHGFHWKKRRVHFYRMIKFVVYSKQVKLPSTSLFEVKKFVCSVTKNLWQTRSTKDHYQKVGKKCNSGLLKFGTCYIFWGQLMITRPQWRRQDFVRGGAWN